MKATLTVRSLAPQLTAAATPPLSVARSPVVVFAVVLTVGTEIRALRVRTV